MAFKIIYNPEVQNDIQTAVDWYNNQQIGLGKRFLTHLKKHLHSLKKTPFNYAIKYGSNIRCMPLHKFPYLIHFRILENQNLILVEAVFHSSRNPNHLNSRKE